MKHELLNDPTASLAESGEVNAVLAPDENGYYVRVIPTPEERERIKMYHQLMIAKMKEDYAPIFAKREQNKKAYEGLPEKGEAITIPVTRAMTNQQHAWLVNQVFSKDPIITCKPLGDVKFNITVSSAAGYQDKELSGQDYARPIEQLIDHKWRTRLPMRKVIRDWAMEALQDGSTPALVKIIHEENSYRVGGRKEPFVKMDPATGQPYEDAKGQKVQIINSPEFRTIVSDETVQIVNVPGEDFMMPLGELDIQRSPIVTFRTEPTTSELRRQISTGKYNFMLPDEEEPTAEQIEKVILGSKDTTDDPAKKPKRAAQQVDKRKEVNPLAAHVVYESYFRWPLLTEPGGDIEWMECVGEYHEGSGEMLCLYLLHTWNGKRPFKDWFMRQRPNSYSGTCTVEDVAPFQRYISQLFHLQVQNMVMRNVSVFFARKNSPSAQYLKGRKLRPGMVIEFDEKDEVESKPLGTPIDSVSQEIAFLKGSAQEMALVTQYDNATADLGRVTAGAFQQQQDLAKQQPELVYQTFADAISSLALMYLQALIQYAPEQKLPNFGEESNAVIDNVLHFPRQMVMDEFSLSVTATARDDTKAAEFQRDLQLTQQVSQANMQFMNIMGTIGKPGTPPQFIEMGIAMLQREEKMLENLFATTRYDASTFALKPETIRNAIMSLMQMQQQMQQMGAEMAPQMGEGDVSADAGGGPPVPPSGDGGPEVGGDVPQEQGNPEVAA
jgi:hypothetical protein